MLHPRELQIADFSYPLSDEKIAKHPLSVRDQSKLLIYQQGNILETTFSKIADHLPENSLLIFNNSKVIQSRITFKKPSGGEIEIFILEPCEEYGDITNAMKTEGSIRCKCLVGGAKKWKQGKINITSLKNIKNILFTAEIVSRGGEEFIIEFQWQLGITFSEILEIFGNTPIPPYLHRLSDISDKERYQTIYAKEEGSVAAPTAGLHFTNEVMNTLKNKNIHDAYITLHVGAGTFKPVKSETIAGHDMHAEFMDVDLCLIEELIRHHEVIPVGTTSMRTIESLYWMGVKTYLHPKIKIASLEITQWEIYDELIKCEISKQVALESLCCWMKTTQTDRLILRTQILIAPLYISKIATGIITNFHQPQSTLLLLIAALVGDDWKKIYHYALENNFRFLSYGDCNLIRW